MRQRLFTLLPMLALACVWIGPAQAAGLTGLLNDTGQTTCYNGSAMVACSSANTGDSAAYYAWADNQSTVHHAETAPARLRGCRILPNKACADRRPTSGCCDKALSVGKGR